MAFFGLGALLAAVGIALATRGGAQSGHRAPLPASSTAPGRGATARPTLWEVPRFAFTSADGDTVDESALRGHVWIADFIFTRCTTMCPVITAQMTLLRRELPWADLRFVSFAIDPANDTPGVLKAFGARWSADSRWLLLRPSPAEVNDFARAMHVPFEPSPDPGEPILHTSMFFLVDRAGGVRGLYGGLDDGSVARLVTDAAGLLADEGRPNPGVEPNEARPPTTAISRGAALFQSVGCSACHSDPKIAPPLAGLSGKAVRLQGAVAIADDLYLRQSIVDPEAKIVAGYSLLMPSYRGRLADSEIDDLVSYLHSLGPAEGSASPAPTGADEVEVHDPVCGMKLAPSRAAASASALGATYFFCSDRCRDQFVRDPSRYALRGGSHGPAER